MSRAHELVWCAGFFDGEGYVTIQKRNSKVNGKCYEGFYLRIGINHVNPEPLYEIKKILGGTLRKQNPAKVIGNRHKRLSWQMSYKTGRKREIWQLKRYNFASWPAGWKESVNHKSDTSHI